MTTDEIRNKVRSFILEEVLPGEQPENLKDDMPLRTSGLIDSMGTIRMTGYLESTADVVVVQPASATLGIVMAFSVIPAVLVALSILVLRGYGLSRSDIDVAAPSGVPASDGGTTEGAR